MENEVLFFQLINGKSRRDLQKLLKYFTGKITSACNVLLSFGIFSINFVLCLILGYSR